MKNQGKEQKTIYYTSLIPAGVQQGAVYVNDTDALAIRQFQEKFDGAFVRWTSSPSSELEEIVDRQRLFQEAFEIARDPKKKAFVKSLSASVSLKPFTRDGVVHGIQDNFWEQYASFLEFLGNEEELPPQMRRLLRELNQNAPIKKREEELLDAIDDKIKESVNSVGILRYNLDYNRGQVYVNPARGDSLTFSFNLYPLKAAAKSLGKSSEELEKEVRETLKRYARKIVQLISHNSKVEEAFRKSGRECSAALSVSYTYNEDGFNANVAVEYVTGDLNPELPAGVSSIEGRFMDRQEQEIAHRYGREKEKPYRSLGNWRITRAALAACYSIADFGKWMWGNIPGTAQHCKKKLRRNARKQFGRFYSEFTDSLQERERNLLAARLQAAISEFIVGSSEANDLRKAEGLAKTIKSTTASMAVEHFGNEISEELNHRKQYGNIVHELHGLVSVAEKYLEIEKQGIPLCFPRFNPGERKSVSAKELYPIRLIAAGSKPSEVVPNDVELNGRPMIITGENGGGKSIYLYSIADMIVQAQTGLPILAREAEMSVVDGVYLHFVKPGDIKQGESRFINEVERLKSIVQKIGPHDIALFDELGSGTDLEGALYVSEMVCDNLAKGSISTVLVTHLGDFAHKSKEKGYKVVRAGEGFRFEEGIGSSKGKHVAMKRGLTQDFFDKALKKSE